MEKVIVIGAGPCGVAAAVELKHCGIEPLLIEKEKVGGLVRNANLLENYPGFPRGIAGKDFAALLEQHLRAKKIAILPGEVVSVKFSGGIFSVRTASASYKTRFLIAACGTTPKTFPGEISPSAKSRVFYEVTRLPKGSEREIVILGAGDAAFDYAASLLALGDKVHIVARGKPSCNAALLKILKQRNLKFTGDTTIETITCYGNRLHLRGPAFDAVADFALVAIGRKPAGDFLDQTVSDAPGFYLTGDAANGKYRQASIAAADGVRAAMSICERILK